jgi:malate dehydrogenase (oxaloacetate-decarboxylating)
MKQNRRPVPIPYRGTSLLEVSLLNKGSAFSAEERRLFGLDGLLPATVETIEEQSKRVYHQFQDQKANLEKHVFLRNLQDKNETLFYHVVTKHLPEMLPVLYTPVVGEACEHFSTIYRAARGIFISYPNRDRIQELLANVTKQKVKVIVVTDGERILGLGDQGMGGMGIPIGKLSLYTACGGISPAYTLPLVLDVGTNNERLLNDPMYLGWRHPRITGNNYDDFVEGFIKAVRRQWPNVLLQFEDFAQKNALPILQKYRDEICCFNDDIQGTAAVTLGSLLAASKANGKKLKDNRVAILGAGSAGCGIAESIVARMCLEGLGEKEARSRLFMVDRFGLLTDRLPNLSQAQAKLAHSYSDVSGWAKAGGGVSLLDTIKNAKPTILIGVSGQPGLFTEEIIRTLASQSEHPIVMPLSNPTSRVEATPADILRWSDARALVATGTPFSPVVIGDKIYPIAQCNNSYIFPGIGLGVLAVGARKITDSMLMASSEALADQSPLVRGVKGGLLPEIEDASRVAREIAFRVAKAAQADGVARTMSDEELRDAIEANFWSPIYRQYVPAPKKV